MNMKPIIVPVVLPALATLLLAQTKPEVQSPTTLRVNGQRVNDHLHDPARWRRPVMRTAG
jgi:hypothetical protein